jgi:hypothetical protein
MAGFEMFLKIGTFLKMYTFNPPFFCKELLFSREQDAQLIAKFNGHTMQCISIDWYLETSTSRSYASVKAKKSSQKATDWSSIKKESSLKETQRS